MLDSVLTSGQLTLENILLCSAVSLVLGLAVAGIYMFKNNYTKGFAITLALLPAIIQAIIMLVNGNLGTGVAVAGAFSLIRFRSAPGSAREIGAIFLAMALGLATGTGYLVFAAVFAVIIGAAMLILQATKFGEKGAAEKDLRITIPENLDYSGIFDDLFAQYTSKWELIKVKTTNLGSMYELHYHATLKDPTLEKEFLDKVRCRNGNLNIVCGRVGRGAEEL